ncbi:MAG: general secretion pathway protein GspK [Candidatus Omnitrophica bacterium]|nr:general secretion pathway protein GspK [Candidatus Omnitrophota bacterium]
MKLGNPPGDQGSVLIASLWLMLFLALVAVSVGVRTRLDAQMMSIQLRQQEQREILESGIQIGRFLIETDPDANEDSPRDGWYGARALTDWVESEGYELEIRDEDGKLNLNRASADQLRHFFEILSTRGAALETDPADLAAGIVRWRGETPSFGSASTWKHKGQPFETLEELLLIENISPRDFASIQGYLTVYGRQGERIPRINLNTVSEEVLEALVMSLASDDFTKKEFLRALTAYRSRQKDSPAPRYFSAADLSTAPLLERIGVSSTVLMVGLVNQFLQFAGVDSSYFTVTARVKDPVYRPGYVSAIVGPTGGRAVPFQPAQLTLSGWAFFRADHLQIINWQEGL